MKYTAKDEQKLMTEIFDPEISENPLKFVKFIFPWGKEGTPLHKHNEPRAWQIEELSRMADHIQANKILMAEGKLPKIYRSATCSGRGVGKSALVAWLSLWQMSCNLGSTTIVTANTESQLKTKTWAELGKWHTLLLNSHWFEMTSMSLNPASWFAETLKTGLLIDPTYYYAKAILWNEEKPDSFAGAHNPNGMLVLFDEASGIPSPVWQVSVGFFTEVSLHRYWFCFSNPRRNTGEFFECFHKARNDWYTRNLDSRSVEDIDVDMLNGIIARYGADSDEARIEVLGQFPRQGDRQFIAREIVEGAFERDTERDDYAGLIMGVDVARFGDDMTCIVFRRGRDARTIPAVKLKGKDNMQVANICADLIEEYKPDAICIDAGNGTGVIDRLREIGYKVNEIWFGAKADNEEWADMRTDLWDRMREWLKGGCIPDDQNLKDDLLGPEYEFTKFDKIKLESKEKMKRRGLASPDMADALCVTFAVKVARQDIRAFRKKKTGRVEGVDYDFFS